MYSSSSLTFDQAASVPVGAQTAWRTLFDQADLQAGQRILIHGAAGGVGLFAVQLAGWKGAHAIGTASASNQDFVRSLGAETVIDYQTTPFETVVHDVDVVIVLNPLDTIGGDVQDRSWQVLRPGGMLVSIVGPLSLGRTRPRSKPRHTVSGSLHPAVRTQRMYSSSQVIQVLPLAEASRAHAISETRHGRGHIVRMYSSSLHIAG